MADNEESLLAKQVAPEPKTNRRKMKIAFVAIIFLSFGALFYNSIYVGYWTDLDERAQKLRGQIDWGLSSKDRYEAELKKYFSEGSATTTSSGEISQNRIEWLEKFIDVETRLVAAREKLLIAVEKRNYLAIIDYAKQTSPIIQERIELQDKEPAQ
jgi:hypothetical protein